MFWKNFLKKKSENIGTTSKKQSKVFVCQFCGAFIKHMSTSCVLCHNVPKSTLEIIQGVLMSSDSMQFSSLKATAQYIIENGQIPDLVEESAKSILQDPKSLESYEPLFHVMSSSQEKQASSKDLCAFHNTPFDLAEEGCFKCVDSGDEVTIAISKSTIQQVSHRNRIAIALEQMSKSLILLVDYAPNPEAFEKFLYGSASDIYHIITHPEQDLHLKSIEGLRNLGELSSPKKGFAVSVTDMEKPDLKLAPHLSEEDLKTLVRFCKNYNYLRKVIL